MNDIEIKTLKMLDVIRRFPNQIYENQRDIVISELETGKVNRYLLTSKEWKVLYGTNVIHNSKGVAMDNSKGVKVFHYDVSELYTNENITIPEVKNNISFHDIEGFTDSENKLHLKLINVLNNNLDNVIIELDEIPILRKVMMGISSKIKKENERWHNNNVKSKNNEWSSDRTLHGGKTSMEQYAFPWRNDEFRGSDDISKGLVSERGIRGEETTIHVGEQHEIVQGTNISQQTDLVSEGNRKNILGEIRTSEITSLEETELLPSEYIGKGGNNGTSYDDSKNSSRKRNNLYERYSDRIDIFLETYGISIDKVDDLLKLKNKYNKEIDELDKTGGLSLFIINGIEYKQNITVSENIRKLNWVEYTNSLKNDLRELFDFLVKEEELETTQENNSLFLDEGKPLSLLVDNQEGKNEEIQEETYNVKLVCEQIIDFNYFDNLDKEKVLEVEDVEVIEYEDELQNSDSLVETTLLDEELHNSSVNEFKCMIEWSELSEVDENSIITIEKLEELKTLDNKIYSKKIEDENKPYSEREYGGYYKTKINVYNKGEIYDSTRLDLGDGIDSNIDIYETLLQYINSNREDILELEMPLSIENKENTLSDLIDYSTISNEMNTVSDKSYSKKEIAAINIKVIHEIVNFENNLGASRNDALLKQYQGFGSIPEVFDIAKKDYSHEYETLKNILNQKEYSDLKESTLTSFYTPKHITESLVSAIKKLGFSHGRILEPCVGRGNILDSMDSEMIRNSDIHAVELDNISSRITKCLYPHINVKNKGFEQTNYNKGAFDLVIGNVPFGNYKLSEREYNKLGLQIHDQFIVKSLDLVKQGGIVALMTTRGTLDKKNTKAREEMAKRGNLIGAVRLPNNTFSHTKVTSDILFFESTGYRELETYPSWVFSSSFESSKATINNYYKENPNNVLGLNKVITNQYGKEEITVIENGSIKEIDNIISTFCNNIYNTVTPTVDIEKKSSYPICTWVKENETYIYYDGNKEISYSSDKKQYLMIDKLLNMYELGKSILSSQLKGISDEELSIMQEELRVIYNSIKGSKPFSDSLKVLKSDDRNLFLNTLEEVEKDKEGKIIRVKSSDIFSKRTLNARVIPKNITSLDGLYLSLNEKNRVDIDYISEISNISREVIIEELTSSDNIIYCPLEESYIITSEYLSGNVRNKHDMLKEYIKEYDIDTELYRKQLDLLKNVIPTKLYLEDISTNLGATWIPINYYTEFIQKLLKYSYESKSKDFGEVNFNEFKSSYNVNKTVPFNSTTLSEVTYGTKRINAVNIFENSLNLQKCLVKDPVPGTDPREYVINHVETLKALEKQEEIETKFREFCMEHKKEKLEEIYNNKFNSVVNQKFDGEYLKFNEMNNKITLREHQKNAVARILQSGNTLLAHSVGAGKTFEIIASAMESKRLGISSKSLVVVPNHLIAQWKNEWMHLYPNANILSSTKKDFTNKNRNIFLNRIASNDYDGIIIGHSQFEKLGLSIEYQNKIINQEMQILDDANYLGEITVKKYETLKKALEKRLKDLIDNESKDTSIRFEDTGIDRLYVDEAHMYKNLGFQTKIQNVSGLASGSGSKRAFDLYMKTKYINEITNNKGVVFATGTPLSNSMAELYTMQKYLQNDTLQETGIVNFDAWASTFGEIIQSFELSADGSGSYQVRNRFSKFNNIPELVTLFKEVADVITSDMLDLPVPPHEQHIVVSPISDKQKEEIDQLCERAELVKNRMVLPTEDNMLKITNDGRKLALDPRLLDVEEDFKESKLNKVSENVTNIYFDTMLEQSTQLVFCDLSTPNKTKFNVYDELKRKLILNDINENEIAFIHDYETETEKEKLFEQVNKGKIRVLLGSTQKMGSGTNVQKKLVALHHVDCPWRPSDIEQRNGRILRQGNMNENVKIFNYITEETFDAYLYQIVENKQKFISQIMTSKNPSRSASDVDEASLSYGEIKAIASGNPLIKEKMEIEVKLNKLYSLERSYNDELYINRNKVNTLLPKEIEIAKQNAKRIEEDIMLLNSFEEFNNYVIDGVSYNKSEVGNVLMNKLNLHITTVKTVSIAKINGFDIKLINHNGREDTFNCYISNNHNYSLKLGLSETGNITRIENTLNNIKEGKLLLSQNKIIQAKESELSELTIQIEKGFSKSEELEETKEKLIQIDELLNKPKEVNISNDIEVIESEIER